ncbi:hypothetical protein Vadar_019906 [Vaccinium darrowii]|uniref:Uncharacterized protein n=1 Tax=Vaccinium darrowii TaxID=229202 RepID=A0ACB7ZCR0_9ERIC|nr:hypothetical protein Vadar_019906 [Vaccinium darrowii]
MRNCSRQPASDVVQRANYLFENGFGKYDLLRDNCEDFATYCRTGILIVGPGRSGQIGSLARKFPETAATPSCFF